MNSKKQKYFSSQYSNQNYNQKNIKKYKQKPQIVLKLRTQYIPLIPADILYRQTLTHLSSPQYRFSLQKILLDLNALLYFCQSDFFEQLQNSSSLRNCLQSCLTCLGKNTYYNISTTRLLSINRQQLQYPKEYFNYYDKLHEVVLKIYYRISQTTKKEYQEIIYDCWLMDMPKMIDLAMIYCVRLGGNVVDGYGNVAIVKEIIGNAIATNPLQYARDFDDFINILYQDKLPLIHQSIQHVINLQQSALHYAKTNFTNPQRSFLITAQKILFQIKDIFTIVSYVYLCFPQGYGQKLATDHEVLQDMIKIFVEFVESTTLWKTGQHKEKFETNFQAIQQACCENFYQNFVILKRVIEKGDSITNNYYSRAINSYCVHSMYFTSPKIKKEHQKLYQQMIKTIVYRIQHDHEMFFLLQAPTKLKSIKLSEDEKVAIKKSHLKINQIYNQIGKIIENQEISNRIKHKIDSFFDSTQKANQNRRFSEQNKIVFGGKMREILLQRKKQEQQQKERKRQIQQQKQKQKLLLQQQRAKQHEFPNAQQLDFSVLNESQQNQQDQLFMDLSFSALGQNDSISSYDEQLSFEVESSPTTQIKTKINNKNNVLQEQIELSEPEMYDQLQEKENQMQGIFKRSKRLLYDDDYQQWRVQKEEYYQSHKPQYGHYMDKLIQREIKRK